jgi:hypothetical protein
MKDSKGNPLRTPDGTLATHEQFVQLHSKRGQEYFGKDYENIEQVYRGARFHNPEFLEKGTFTANKNVAKRYANIEGVNRILTPDLDPLDSGLYNLARKKSKNSFELNFNKDYWDNLPLESKEIRIEAHYNDLKDHINILKTEKKKDPELYDLLKKSAKVRIHKERDYLNNLKSSKDNNDQLMESFRSELGKTTTTDDFAKYLEKHNIDNIKLNNIIDEGLGDVTIVNHKQGNYLKSLIGNNGMFDMTNPNIYKGLIPAAGLYGLSQQNK